MDPERLEVWRRAISLLLAIGAATVVGLLFWALWVNRFDPVLTELVLGNFVVIVGHPFAAIASFIIVAVFRQGEHPVEFQGLGFSFKGPAGEIVLWIGCFLAIVGAIKLLWMAR